MEEKAKHQPIVKSKKKSFFPFNKGGSKTGSKENITEKIKKFVEEKPLLSAAILAGVAIVGFMLIGRRGGGTQQQQVDPITVGGGVFPTSPAPAPSPTPSPITPDPIPQHTTGGVGETPNWQSTINEMYRKMEERLGHMGDIHQAANRDTATAEQLRREAEFMLGANVDPEFPNFHGTQREQLEALTLDIERVRREANNPEMLSFFNREWGSVDNYIAVQQHRMNEIKAGRLYIGNIAANLYPTKDMVNFPAHITGIPNMPGVGGTPHTPMSRFNEFIAMGGNLIDWTPIDERITTTAASITPNIPSPVPTVVQPSVPNIDHDLVSRLQADIGRVSERRNLPETIAFFARQFGSVEQYLQQQIERLRQVTGGTIAPNIRTPIAAPTAPATPVTAQQNIPAPATNQVAAKHTHVNQMVQQAVPAHVQVPEIARKLAATAASTVGNAIGSVTKTVQNVVHPAIPAPIKSIVSGDRVTPTVTPANFSGDRVAAALSANMVVPPQSGLTIGGHRLDQ